ncbi:AbrB/MazE/SpoVT family DNA-binding domain-containing protein [Alkalicoccus urumqiensis]|nr:AbrB/MazE/SpoVT family DNA-binding domain-containing protein [Alkalicoccus urumqiensis]
MKEHVIRGRVSKVNNTFVVSIPAEARESLRLEIGDELEAAYDQEAGTIEYKKSRKPRSLPEGVRPDTEEAMNQVMSRYNHALRNLKDR